MVRAYDPNTCSAKRQWKPSAKASTKRMTMMDSLRKVLRMLVIMRMYIPRKGNIWTLDKKMIQATVMVKATISHCHHCLSPVSAWQSLKSTTNIIASMQVPNSMMFCKFLK